MKKWQAMVTAALLSGCGLSGGSVGFAPETPEMVGPFEANKKAPTCNVDPDTFGCVQGTTMYLYLPIDPDSGNATGEPFNSTAELSLTHNRMLYARCAMNVHAPDVNNIGWRWTFDRDTGALVQADWTDPELDFTYYCNGGAGFAEVLEVRKPEPYRTYCYNPLTGWPVDCGG